jgi:hypothetical protein
MQVLCVGKITAMVCVCIYFCMCVGMYCPIPESIAITGQYFQWLLKFFSCMNRPTRVVRVKGCRCCKYKSNGNGIVMLLFHQGGTGNMI